MFIQTERTPNPATLKFIPGRTILESGTADFTQADLADGVSPLAMALFGVSGVDGVFLGTDFITVTKADDQDWQQMKPQVLAAMMQHFSSGAPILMEGADVPASGPKEAEVAPEDAKLVEQIKVLLDEKIRPAVAQDGGDIIFHDYKEGIVFLHLQGACAGCPSSTMTLKQGIENLLRYYIPEITEVRALQ